MSGPIARSLGGSGLVLSNAWSIFNNQAAMANVEHLNIGASATRIYNIEQLNEMTMGFSLPVKNAGTLGISYSGQGIAGLYQQNEIGLAMARSFGANFSMGIAFQVLNISIPEYGNKWLLKPELGIILKPEENLSLAVHISNPFGAFISESANERAPTQVRIGAGYSTGEAVKLLAEVSAASNQKTRLHAGLLYTLNEKVQLSTGFSTRDLSSSFGAHFTFKKVSVNLAFSYHQRLGSTPELGMAYAAD